MKEYDIVKETFKQRDYWKVRCNWKARCKAAEEVVKAYDDWHGESGDITGDVHAAKLKWQKLKNNNDIAYCDTQ